MNKIKNLFDMKLQGLFSRARVCTTRKIDEHLFECKVKKPDPKYCEHSLSMGNGFICKHRDRLDFAGK